jgi:hypothetical protein
MMDKYSDYNLDEEPQNDKYQCPDTGAHFYYLDMIRRLKNLKTRRQVID